MDQDLNLLPDFKRNWKDLEVTWKAGDTIKDEEACFFYKGDQNQITPLAGKGELVVYTGREKSRKSLLLQCAILSAYGLEQSTTMGYELLLDGPILHFDTEQSSSRVWKNRRRFNFITGQMDNDPYYRTFSIKHLTSPQMMEFISFVIEEVSQEMGMAPGLIAIDQVADLMPGRDVNDPAGADNILNHLNLWGEMTGALMKVVIHTNRGGKETNGVLGALLDKKADCTFLVSMDEESQISTVLHKHSKDKRIPKFTFTQDVYGNPEFLKSLEQNYNL